MATLLNPHHIFRFFYNISTRTIYTRVAGAIVLIVAGYALLFMYFVNSYASAENDNRRDELKRIVEVALNTLRPIREQQERGELTREQALTLSTNLVRRMTYHYGNYDNYLYMSSYNGIMLVQPFEEEKQGTNQFDLQDANGKYVIRGLIQTARSPQGGGFFDYVYAVPGTKELQPKLSYVVGIPEWKAYIGTGVYLKDMRANVDSYVQRSLLLTLGMLLILLIVLYISIRPSILSYQTLQLLFNQVTQYPDSTPSVPLNHFKIGSEGWRLLNGFQVMLTELHLSKQALLEREEALEQRIRERTHELSTLLSVSRKVASTLELQALLRTILEQLGAVVEYDGASIMDYIAPDKLKLIDYLGPIPRQELHWDWSFDHAIVNREVIVTRSPVIIPDTQADTPMAAAFRVTAGNHLQYVNSYMGIPLMVRDHVIGMLGFDHKIKNYYSEHHAQLAMAFAYQAAVAMDNAQLFRQEQERRQEAETGRQVAEGLRDVLTMLNSHNPLDAILARIIAQSARLLDTNAAAIFRLNHETGILTIQTAYGLPDQYVREMSVPVGQSVLGRAVQERKPVYVPDRKIIIPNYNQITGAVTQTLTLEVMQRFSAVLATPLIIKDEVYGGIVLYYTEPHNFSDDQLGLISAFADQAALAIENARLRAQAEQSAAAAERQRLARDLHDAVTQTLFSASLIAEVLPRLFERNPDEGKRRLEELRQLARGALAEMRTLLLELRPSALTDIKFGDLLRQLGEAITGRARTPVTVSIEGDVSLSPEVQVALYRITQEALNNIVKHAYASAIHVGVACLPSGVDLTIHDDGRGFDPESVTGDHFGLKIMRERADTIGASFQIESSATTGTSITIRWKNNQEKK